MELMDRLIDFIEGQVELNAPIQVGILSQSPKAVCFRLTPGSFRDVYLNHGRVYQLSFQILVKDDQQSEAIRVIHDVVNVLDRLTEKDIVLSNDRFIRCEVYTLPSFVEKTEHDEYIYTALFNAEYERKGE
ncbi:minor capsid protein [Geobacillus stearothermophilus]|nr:minor capsid protein [Geobacillus stearothermophilus]